MQDQQSLPSRFTQKAASPRLGDLSATQWKSGIAAWLGWLFDGLDMHLYTLVAAPFVAQLLHVACTRCIFRLFSPPSSARRALAFATTLAEPSLRGGPCFSGFTPTWRTTALPCTTPGSCLFPQSRSRFFFRSLPNDF